MTITIPVTPAVAKALVALGLPGELPQETLARIVWAFGTTETRKSIEGASR